MASTINKAERQAGRGRGLRPHDVCRAVQECAAQTESVSARVLQCILSDMAAQLISLSYRCCQLLPPEKVTEGRADSKHSSGTIPK